MGGLYEQTRATPGTVDFDTLRLERGVRAQSGRVVFDDEAPRASIQRSIMSRSANV